MTLTVGSLFSGIGGIDLGLERAGMKVIWQVEKDPYARKVLKKHWPDVPCYEDIRDTGGAPSIGDPKQLRWRLETVDLVCGGFPCQDISNAGKRKGIEGERSGLWKEFYRVVREIRPRFVLVENVSALRSRGLDVVLGDLATSGYDAEWDCIPAAAVGAPHRRDRIFIVAYPNADGERLAQRGERDRQAHPGLEASLGNDARGLRADVADAAGARHPSGQSSTCGALWNDAWRAELERFRSESGRRQWSIEPNVGRVADGVPARVDRLRCLGNAVVPQVAEYVGRLILARFDVADSVSGPGARP